jgi:cellulose synthase/poly-beta-1,6-N-acetylglucosamine synthase-like glycosyltransferase
MFLFLKVIPSLFYRQIKKITPSDDLNLEEVSNTDVTVVVAVYQPPDGFYNTIKSIADNNPAKILIVADITCVDDVKDICKDFDQNILEVLPEEKAGKRAALVSGIKASRTKITCLVDDDIIWCPTLIENMILPFQYSHIGGVGVRQNAFIRTRFDMFDILNNMRLAVRYLEIKATTVIDGGCVCISGRTACYRTDVIQREDMYEKFMKEKFLCLSVLSGDDKFLTRYVINNGYKTYHQLLHNCELSTPFEKGERLFKQFIRWSRNTWRSDFNAIFIERKIWRNNPYTAFVMFDKIFVPFLMIGGVVYTLILCFTHKSLLPNLLPSQDLENYKHTFDYQLFIAYIVWLLISRTIKLYYYLWEFPSHIIMVPVFVFFQFVQAFIRIYALITIYERGWGTRKIDVVGNEVVRSMPLSKPQVIIDIPDTQEISRESASKFILKEDQVDHEQLYQKPD